MSKNDKIKSWLGKKVEVKIDRPLGSKHPDPRFSTVYPINYGFIPGTNSPVDNEEIDAYVFGPEKPIKKFSGTVIAVIVREDDEIKLIVTDGKNFTKKEIEDLTYFQEKYYQSVIIK